MPKGQAADYPVQGFVITNNGFQTPYDGTAGFPGSGDDTLAGVINRSGDPITSISLGVLPYFAANDPNHLNPIYGLGVTNQPFFGFDGDGPCSAFLTPKAPGCPFQGSGLPAGLEGYEGPGVTFSFINFNPVNMDPRGGQRSGTIAFTGGLGQDDGTNFSVIGHGHAYFALEDVLPVQGTGFSGASIADFSTQATGPLIFSTPIQGSVQLTAISVAAPEPTSLFLIGSGLAVFLFRLRAGKTKVAKG